MRSVFSGFCLVVASIACAQDHRAPDGSPTWVFEDVTQTSGLLYPHGYLHADPIDEEFFSGGVAAGDFDRDGWVDLYVVRGELGPNMLFHNQGDGSFTDVAGSAGVGIQQLAGSGPLFADMDGDGWLDLFVGTALVGKPHVFRNLGNGSFEDVSDLVGFSQFNLTNAATFGDYDLDGDLDLFLSQWNLTVSQLMWRNDGPFQFTSVSDTVFPGFHGVLRSTFTPNFTDLNRDGWPDLVVASDFGRSQVMHNTGVAQFSLETSAVITDEHGMGAAVGDYDNDGDMDWFVTSIYYDGPGSTGTGITGNRLYQNQGDGSFLDVTDVAGVRNGHWGWGAVFADLDNDGDLDLYHVNGWRKAGDHFFDQDANRFFRNNGDGSFTEMANILGTADAGQGRGVVAFDYDRDGDLDLYVANNSGQPRFFRNTGLPPRHFLQIELSGVAPNTEGIGAWVELVIGSNSQWREMRCGSNYLSQNPAIAHFGLDQSSRVTCIGITWLHGTQTVIRGIRADQRLTVDADLLSQDSFEGEELSRWRVFPP